MMKLSEFISQYMSKDAQNDFREKQYSAICSMAESLINHVDLGNLTKDQRKKLHEAIEGQVLYGVCLVYQSAKEMKDKMI